MGHSRRQARRGRSKAAPTAIRSIGLFWGLLALLGGGACQKAESTAPDPKADLGLPPPPDEDLGSLPDADTSGPPIFVATEAELDPAQPKLRVAMVDVGQGDALVVFLPGGKVLGVDGGPFEGRDDYRRFLDAEGVKTLDYVVLSHAHSDHYTGLSVALDRLPKDCAARVFDPGYERGADAPGHKTFRDTAGCRFRPLSLNASLLWDPAVGIEVMGVAAQPFPDVDNTGINNTSAMLRLYYGRFSMLLTGDAQTEAERVAVSANRAHLASTVLKVGHHGSCNATGGTLLTTVAPSYALISARNEPPPGNDFGHPHCQTLNKLKAQGVHWYRTDVNGDVQVITDGTRYTFRVGRGARDVASCPRSCAMPTDF